MAILLRLCGQPRVHYLDAEHLCRPAARHHRGHGLCQKAENRKAIAEAIAPTNYLNQPQIVLEQISPAPMTMASAR